jgi:hypothetical protein
VNGGGVLVRMGGGCECGWWRTGHCTQHIWMLVLSCRRHANCADAIPPHADSLLPRGVGAPGACPAHTRT